MNNSGANTQGQILNQVTEISVNYNNKIKPSARPKICKSSDAYDLLLQTWDGGTIDIYESFKIIMLNRANKVLGISLISEGGVSGTVVDPKRIFATALLSGCSSIILSHNHPSGSTTPSDNDRKITKKLCDAGTMLEINVLDHLIITSESFFSFADEGEL
ncbi:MAG: JAB domain-containing protein [Bacteroidetes bacterium]|nr:JAB domain-containing protein [Bacteroidota bacterium]